MVKSRKNRTGRTSPARTGMHAVKSLEERQAYEAKVRHTMGAGDTSEPDATKRKDYGGRAVDVQDKELPGARGARKRIEPPKQEMPYWSKVTLGLITLVVFVGGIIYTYAQLEASIRVNNDKIDEARKDVKGLYEQVVNIRERLAKLEEYTRLAQGDKGLMINLKIEVDKLRNQLDEVEKRGLKERQSLLKVIDKKVSSLEARMSNAR